MFWSAFLGVLQAARGIRIEKMAQKRKSKTSNKRRSTSKRKSQEFNLKGWHVGVVLIFIAFLMVISMFAPSRGAMTDWLVRQAWAIAGFGAYLLPVLLGWLGVYLVARGYQKEEPAMPWEPLLGFALLFLSLEPLLAAAGRDAGGWLGRNTWNTLALAFGTLVASMFLAIIALAGALLMVRVSPQEALRFVASLPRFLRREAPAPEPEGPLFQTTTDEVSGGSPWQRLVERLKGVAALKGRVQPPQGEAQPRPETPQQHSVSGPAQIRPMAPRIIGRPVETSPIVGKDIAPVGPPSRVVEGSQVWELPGLDEILEEASDTQINQEILRERARVIEETLQAFGVPVQVVEVNRGPTVTQFGVRPGYVEKRTSSGKVERVKVKVSKIQALANDLSLALAAAPLRIEAPVPGRSVVGIEVPNTQVSLVSLRGIMESEKYQNMKSLLRIPLGRDVSGNPVVADMTRMPHLLVAGATGSGKSVCINSILTSLLITNTPTTLRLFLVDPKMVELIGYNGIPHLIAPVIVEPKQVVKALRWTIGEMERRYKTFSKAGARDLPRYNEQMKKEGEPTLPYILFVVDELADVILVAPDEVEQQITRLAQMARATGIHLILATQRPSVDVVTGLIKANFPARVAFAVTSQVDSRVILDMPGAEQLLGRGDMLYLPPDSGKPRRLQGAYVSEREIQRIVRYWKGIRGAVPSVPREEEHVEGGEKFVTPPLWENLEALEEETERKKDDLFDDAVSVVRESGRASISLLQRKLRVGYTRAARLMDMLEEEGIVGPDESGRGRKVL